ncbi:MAG TPA: ROK family protein [Desulfosporosinus sp.]|nr:ROK family protein [Desulfosporosinus sp.]
MQLNHILGIDIGGTKTGVVCGTSSGEILLRSEFPTMPGRKFQEYFIELCSFISTTLQDSKCEATVISVSVGGPLDVFEGVIKSPPHLPEWCDVPLKKLLSDEFKLPVYIEHDGNAGALAEYFFGAGRGSRSIVFLTLGTGFGAGLILDGRLYRGTSFVAGEIGHIRIADNGPYAYGKHGSLEAYCSGAGIEKLAGIMFPDRWAIGISARELGDLAKDGDVQAIAVLEISGKYLGRAFALIADFVNPQKIILGGLGFRLGSLLTLTAMEEFKREALRESFEVCEIVPAQLNERIGDLASICAAIYQGGAK